MRRPQVSVEKKDYTTSCQPQSSSGAFARVRRFLSVSIGGQQHSSIPSRKRPCDSLAPPSHSLRSLRAEAETILGRPLEDILRDEVKEPPQGIPSFVHELCCYMLTHGVDFETLAAEDWCPDRATLMEGLPHSLVGDISSKRQSELTAIAALFRLFLQELPHPLLGRDAVVSLTRVCKEMESYDDGRDLELFQEMAFRVRSILFRKVPSHNLNMLQYLTTFLHQVRTANHNKCPVDQTSLSRLLGMVLTEGGMKGESTDSSLRLAEMLLLNHAVIFRDSAHYSQEVNYSSDSVSSACDSHGETTDDADLFTPDDDEDDDDDEDTTSGRGIPGSSIDAEEDSTTTTTTDTDEFRSPPVSPIKIVGPDLPIPGTSSPGRTRKVLSARGQRSSSQNVCGGSSFPLDSASPVTPDPRAPSLKVDEGPTSFLKRSPFSFESFLKSRSKSARVLGGEILRRKRKGQTDEGSQGHDYKALRSTDELPDEERFISKISPFGKDYLPSITGLLTSPYDSWSLNIHQPKEDTQNDLYEPDTTNRIQSSEEEERETPPSTFASLLSRDESPAPFDPTPPESSQSFSALLSSEEPVTSHRSPLWGECLEDSLHNNWQRTAPHYSREDVDTSMKSVNWYREETVDHDSRHSTKFCDSSSIDPLDEGSRPRGGHSAIKLLSKNVSSLKRKIKKFEEEFERSYGYRPSHSDKMKQKDIKKYMSDLSKAKKELKQMKEDIPDKRSVKGFPKPFPMSLLRCQEATGTISQQTTSSSAVPPNKETKDTYRQVEDRLSVKRTEARRPCKVADLSLDQLKEEKTDIQKALLFYESVHGRPYTREDKELVRPLYDRYRLVKRSVNKLISRPKESVIELAPILEHVVMDFTLASPQHRGSLKEEGEMEEQDVAMANLPLNPDPHPDMVPASTPELNLGDLHALPIHELKERKKEAKEEKRKLRHSLREYEEKFERETGRKMQKEDRGHMEKNYNEYKHVKAKLRLLEALLSKHSS